MIVRHVGAALLAASVAPLCAFGPQTVSSPVPDFIVTAAPVFEPLAALRGKERFPQGAQLLRVHAGKAEPLVDGFAQAADANVAFDGKTVLFAGKKTSTDPWQVYELTFASHAVRRVTATDRDAERPMYMPGGRMVYAGRTEHGFALVTVEDGHPVEGNVSNPTTPPGALQLTYLGANSFPADVLADGRILFESGYPLGEGDTPELYLVYADGSGVESYRCDHGAARWGGAQLASGDVVFTHGASLARFTSPRAQEERIAAPAAEYAGGIAEMPDGSWLLSARANGAQSYAINRWTPGERILHRILFEGAVNLVEPVLMAPRATPRRHPSGLHPWNDANLLVLDARLTRDAPLRSAPVTVQVEAQDAAGKPVALGTAPIEADGSFFVKTPADRAIRFVLLNAHGEVLRQERGWFWVRKGEQRICVGCHTGPERASENRVPDVLVRTTVPVDLTTKPQQLSTGGN